MTRDELLQAFCSDNELRPTLCKPFRQGDYTCATDAYYGIMLPTIEEDKTAYDIHPIPKMLHFLQQVGQSEKELSYKELSAALVEIESQLAQIDLTCPECKGEGEVEFYYLDRHKHCHTTKDECPECEGEGQMDISDWYGKKKYTYILDDDYCFRVPTLRVIVKTMEHFHLDSITLLQSTTADTFPFHIIGDGFHVVCMPAKINKDEDED